MAQPPESERSGGAHEAKLKYMEILQKNRITEPVSEVLIKDAGIVGFVSKSLYVTVMFENTEVPELHLFAKVHTSNISDNAMATNMKAFEKEARFFTEYIPVAEKLCKENGQLELIDIYPKCYYGDDKLIVLENLVLEKGYVLHSHQERQGLEEATAALLSLAKHHAISHAMIQKYGGGEGFLKAFKDFDFDPFTKHFFTNVMGSLMASTANNNKKLLEKHKVEGGEIAIERIKSIGENPIEKIINSLEIDATDNFFVLNHGDCHSNNMMFLKDPNRKVLHHKLIDFQIVRYNSPAVDLGHFLFSSVKPDVRQKHLKELLTIYFTKLKNVCKDLGHNIEYSYDDLFLQFRKRFYQGFWLAFNMFIPGKSVLNDLQDNERGDPRKMAELIEKAIQKWIDENPEEGEKVAKGMVQIVQEFYELQLD